MPVTTEPKPLTGPLPGGSDGATVRLHPLLAGEMLSPPGYLERRTGRLGALRSWAGGLTPRSRWDAIPVPAFLVEHPSAGPLLVDTGLHPSVADGARANMGPLAPLIYHVRMEREQALALQLEARGVDPAAVRTIVMTHLHIDHASAVSEFPAATFVVDRREWASACERGGARRGYQPRQFDHGADWRTIDYDAPSIDSFATFAQSLDLFGDGSVRLLSTPGHARGHQSLLLRLREREALLTGDAAYMQRTIETGAMPLMTDDEHHFRRSLREIQRYVEQAPGALVVTGHDAATWPQLAAVYD